MISLECFPVLSQSRHIQQRAFVLVKALLTPAMFSYLSTSMAQYTTRLLRPSAGVVSNGNHPSAEFRPEMLDVAACGVGRGMLTYVGSQPRETTCPRASRNFVCPAAYAAHTLGQQ